MYAIKVVIDSQLKLLRDKDLKVFEFGSEELANVFLVNDLKVGINSNRFKIVELSDAELSVGDVGGV